LPAPMTSRHKAPTATPVRVFRRIIVLEGGAHHKGRAAIDGVPLPIPKVDVASVLGRVRRRAGQAAEMKHATMNAVDRHLSVALSDD
jgi:hypothetical protein